jgi:hypothetical protein
MLALVLYLGAIYVLIMLADCVGRRAGDGARGLLEPTAIDH